MRLTEFFEIGLVLLEHVVSEHDQVYVRNIGEGWPGKQAEDLARPAFDLLREHKKKISNNV